MKKMSIFAMLLAAVLVTSYSVSGTYAKYTSTYTATDATRVAKWAFSFKGNDTATQEFTFDLFNTVNDSTGSEETDILTSNGTIIAPGTQGSFKIGLTNDSEVNAKYAIDFTMSETANIPVEFSIGALDQEGNQIWVSDINDLDITDTNIEMINKNGAEATHTIQWRWVFEVDENGNTVDTTLGTAGTDTITVTAKVTATQVD